MRSETPQTEVRLRPSIRLMKVVTAAEPAVSVGLKINLTGGASMLVRDDAQAALAARLLKTQATASSC